MFAATRRWFRRNRTTLAYGAGILSAGYVAAQYVLGKLAEARERRNSEHISREKYDTRACANFFLLLNFKKFF
jgi:peroxin-3